MNNVVINVIRVLAILFITVFSITINAGVSILIIIIYVISILLCLFYLILLASHCYNHFYHHHDFHLS